MNQPHADAARASIPRSRKWRFAWWALVGLGVIVVGIAAWWIWSIFAAQRAFEAEIARLRAAGQLVTVDDYNSQPPVPDAENAAVLYEKAFATPRTPAQDDFEANIDASLRLTAAQKTVLRTFPVTFAESLQLARQARQCRYADFGVVVTSPLLTRDQPQLTNCRQLALAIKYSAVAYHLDGRDGEAVESVRDLLHLAAMVDDRDSTLVSHLVAIGIAAMASDHAMELSQDLRIGAPPAASVEQVRGLIAHLLDPGLDPGLAEALKGEQAAALDLAVTLGQGKGRAIPSFKWNAVRYSQFLSDRIADIDVESAPNTMARWNTYPARGRGWTNPIPDLLEMTLPAVSKACPIHFKVKSDARAAAVMLAARLYRQDHQNAWPPSLESLVPTYLPAIPRDPFSPTGGSMTYLPSATVDGVSGPVIYSVGDDGTDQQGSTTPLKRGRVNNKVWNNVWNHQDAVYPFLRPPPAESEVQND